jgi:(p)ppGpp synthase/HD superfamily hydrolase
MKNKDSNKLIYQARDYAVSLHSSINQKYGDFCYSKHLFDLVLNLVSHNYTDPEFLITAYLHDVLEDVPTVTEVDISNRFGTQVLNNVIALSKLPNGKPNYELLNARPVAKAVKIADTISNLGQGLVEKNNKSFKYVKRMQEFENQLFIEGEHESLWKALSERISVYKLFVLDSPKLIAV